MTTAKTSSAPSPYPAGSIRVTLSSYSQTCVPTIYYRLPNTSHDTTYTGPFVISASGTTTVEYWAKDLTGNVEKHRFLQVVSGVPLPSLSLSTLTPVLTYPTIATLVAVSSDASATEVTLQARRVDLASWNNVGVATSCTGRFLFLTIPNFGYVYRAVAGGEQSNEVQVGVKVPLSRPSASAKQVRVGRAVTFAGTIRPAHPVGPHASDIKFLLQWQRRDASTGVWHAASAETTLSLNAAVDNDTTRWTYDQAGATGRWRVRFVHECPRHLRSYSPWREFAVVK